MSILILGFPGVGKTTYARSKSKKYTVSDSDSSMFSWKEEGVRHPEWPDNYIRHIKSLIGKVDVIFISTHAEVREAVRADPELEQRAFTVLPDGDRKDAFMLNYKQRGSDENFLDLMDRKWSAFRRDAFKNGVGCRILLPACKFIDDELIDRFMSEEI